LLSFGTKIYNMVKFLLVIIIVLSPFLEINAQNQKTESKFNSDVSKQELYVSFITNTVIKDSKGLDFFIASSPELFDIKLHYQLQFEKGISISEEKLEFLEKEATRISGNGESVRKLRNIFKVKTPDTTNENLQNIALVLQKSKQVAFCSIMSLEPIAPPIDIVPVTPNFEVDQTYLESDPGVNMSYAWSLGLNGSGIRIRDVEYGFNKNHEELIDVNVFLAPGMNVSASATASYVEHGTAVLGILYGHKGNYGISGMAHGAQEVVLFPEWQQTGYNRLNALTKSIDNSVAGDVIVIETQTYGAQGGFGPAEYEFPIWALVKAASDAGIIVVAVAGNGQEDLDSDPYTSYRSRGNSGAIIVGGGLSNTTHDRISYSTYGSRVDVQGWAQNVRTSGYGDLIMFGSDINQGYTNFSGTSSATAIVASCVVVLQSYYHSLTGSFMNSEQMKLLLKQTGVPQGTAVIGNIGPLPNMEAAILQINSTLGLEDNSKTYFTIYPNPFEDILNLNIIDNVSKNAKVEIYNIIGQIVYNGAIVNGLNEIYTKQLLSGVYIVKVIDGYKISTKKIIKP
jgi:hypothetical protein